jgi:hypothetical protein
MLKQLKEFHPKATVHGMRSSWRTWAEKFVPESDVKDEAKEWVLMHADKNTVKERYLRGTYYDERMYLLPVWGRWLNNPQEVQHLSYKEIVEKMNGELYNHLAD